MDDLLERKEWKERLTYIVHTNKENEILDAVERE
jgi:hypothetical protein